EKRLGSCLQHLSNALASITSQHPPADSPQAKAREIVCEVIVVDNNSTDATAELARGAGARVVFEPINQISRARNAGAIVATGDWLVFVDADTLVSAGTLAEMLALIHTGKYAGGGTRLRYDRTPLFWRGFLLVSNHVVTPLLGWTP